MIRYCIVALLTAGLSIPAGANWEFGEGHWVDLSHTYGPDTIYWPTSEKFGRKTVFEGMTDKGFYYSAFAVSTAEHGGTHVDAPIHFAFGRETVDRIPIEKLIGPAVVVDVSAEAAENADLQVGVDAFERFEDEHGRIPDGSIVLIHTGFGSRWPDALTYLGTETRGEQGVRELHFPGIHPEAATWLADERQIAAVGLDTASIDYGQSTHYLSHRILSDKNIPGFENLANLHELPPTGALLIALPMKIKGGSGGPLRAVAFVPSP